MICITYETECCIFYILNYIYSYMFRYNKSKQQIILQNGKTSLFR